MALYNNILLDIQSRKIPQEFRTADLTKYPNGADMFLVGNASYKLSTLKTLPANLAVDAQNGKQGKHVGNGAEARFERISIGLYRLLCSDSVQNVEENNQELDNSNEIDQMDYGRNLCSFVEHQDDPVELIAQHLKNAPYQLYFKRQRTFHPKTPAVGLRGRVNTYFWPKLTDTWGVNKDRLSDYESRFKALEPIVRTQESGNELSDLFADICRWGGVKVPDIDNEKLELNVIEVLTCIDKEQLPPKSCGINGAYTKLYALARPTKFVIFDSRVAAALISILDPYMESISLHQSWTKYDGLGYVSGRGGSRPRLTNWSWKPGYQKWEAQFAANALCLDVLKRINSDLNLFGLEMPLTLRELEAILFMEGY